MMYIEIIKCITKVGKDKTIMRTIGSDNRTKELRIKENFKISGLTEEQYINACKQYLYAKRDDHNFEKLSSSSQETYLVENNVLGYRFLGDRGLVEILKNFNELTLTEIYSIIVSLSPRLNSVCNVNINFSTLLNDKDNILIVNAETFLNQIPSMCSLNKKITMWTIDTFIQELLAFDYENNKNISIKAVNIYNNQFEEQEKFKNILCIPPFGLKRRFERGKYYGNDSSTIAAELLFKNNLADDGTLSIIMPSKVNFSQTEAHFRQAYEKNLIEVIDLPSGTFSNTNIKTYLYKFSKEYSDNLFISHSIDTLGEKYNLTEVTNVDSTWDFEKPFKEEDEDIVNVLNKDHKKLSEISTILRGKPLSKYAQETNKNEDFIYLDMRAIKEDGIDFSEAKKYRLDKDLSSEYLQDGDLLIPNKGNTSKVVLYKNSDKNCIASANLLVIHPDNKQISSEYLLTYLRSAVGQKLIKGLLRGTAMPFINHEDLKGIAVIVPALTKQKELIKNYTSKMEKYRKQLEQIKNDIMQLEQDVNDIICGTKQDF